MEKTQEIEIENENLYTSVVLRPQKALYNQEGNDFKIYSCKVVQSDRDMPKSKYGTISLKGEMSTLELHEDILVDIVHDKDKQYPTSYTFVTVKYAIPDDPLKQQIFLKPLVSPVQFESIYQAYSSQDRVIDKMFDGTFLDRNVRGIKEHTLELIKENIEKKIEMNDLITFLNPYGVSIKMIERIHDQYGDSKLAIEKIKENPYNLLSVRGIGFVKADDIALSMGLPMDSEQRILNSFAYIIEDRVFSMGDTYLTVNKLIVEASGLLMISKKIILTYMNKELLAGYNIYLEGDIVTTLYMYNHEKYIADTIIESKKHVEPLLDVEYIENFINEYEVDNNVKLADEQREFLFNCNLSRVSFLIGGGGMGKTWLMQLFTTMLRQSGKDVTVLAPTGKASKVISNYIGMEASTIHRALRLYQDMDLESFTGEDSMINSEVVIVDEVSMCDVELMSALLHCVDLRFSRLVFIGDDYQLASVGAGNFLYDCINSNVVNVTKLTKVFRQKEGGVATVADNIRKQKHIISGADQGRVKFGKDMAIYLTDSAQILEMLVTTYKNILSQGHTVDDIMILSPTSKSMFGTKHVNKLIQEIVNPYILDSDEYIKNKNKDESQQITFRVADRVINLVNNYELYVVDENYNYIELSKSSEESDGLAKTQIFNGETGIIKKIDNQKNKVYVDFSNELVEFELNELGDKIIHSYCITIHKSQGSQAKFVICLFDRSSTFQLNANLIYTGITRTQVACCVFTQNTTFLKGIHKFNNMQRKTLLGSMLENK